MVGFVTRSTLFRSARLKGSWYLGPFPCFRLAIFSNKNTTALQTPVRQGQSSTLLGLDEDQCRIYPVTPVPKTFECSLLHSFREPVRQRSPRTFKYPKPLNPKPLNPRDAMSWQLCAQVELFMLPGLKQHQIRKPETPDFLVSSNPKALHVVYYL